MSKIQVNNGKLYIPYDYSTDKVIIGVKDSSGKLVAAKTVVPVRDALPSLNIQIIPVKDSIVYLDGNYGAKNTLIFDTNYTLNGKTIYNSDVEYKTLDSNYEISVISPTQIEIVVKSVSNYIKSKISDKNTYSYNIPFSLTYNGCEYEFNIGITFNKTSYQFTSMYDTIYISNRTANNSSNNSLIDINGYFNNVPIDKDEMTLTLSDDFSNIAKSLKMVSLDKSNNDWYFNYNLKSSNSVYNIDDFVVDKLNKIYDIRNKFNVIDTNNNVYFKDGKKVIDVSGNIYHNNIKIYDNSTNATMQQNNTNYTSIDSSNNIFWKGYNVIAITNNDTINKKNTSTRIIDASKNIYYDGLSYKVIDVNNNICWKNKKDVSAITSGNVINRIDTSTKIIDNNNYVYLSDGIKLIYNGTDIYGDNTKIADKNKKILGYSGYYLDSSGNIYNNLGSLYLDSSVVSVGDYSLNVYDKVIKKSTRTYYNYKTDTFYINGGSSYKLVSDVVKDSRNNTIINSSLVLTDSSFNYDISNGGLTYNGVSILTECNKKSTVNISNGYDNYYTITSGLSGLSVCFSGTNRNMVSGNVIYYVNASGGYSSFNTTSTIDLNGNYKYDLSTGTIKYGNTILYNTITGKEPTNISTYLSKMNNSITKVTTYKSSYSTSSRNGEVIFTVDTSKNIIKIYDASGTYELININKNNNEVGIRLVREEGAFFYKKQNKIVYNGNSIIDCITKRCNLSNNYYFDYVNKKIYYSTNTTPIATLNVSSIQFGNTILNYDTNGNASVSVFNGSLKIKDKKLEVVDGTYYYLFDTKKIVDNSSNTFIDSSKDIYAINGKIFDGSSLYIAGGSKLLDVDDKIFYCVKNLYTYDINKSKILYNSSDYVTFNSKGIDLNYVKVSINNGIITYNIDANTYITKNTSNSTITYKMSNSSIVKSGSTITYNIDTNTSIEKNTTNSTITYKMSDSSIVRNSSGITYTMSDSSIVKSDSSIIYKMGDSFIEKNTSNNNFTYTKNDKTNGKLDLIKNTSQYSYSYKLNDSPYLTYNISTGNIYGSNSSTIITNSTKKDRPIYYFDSSYKLSFDNKEVSAIEDSSILYDTSGNIAIIANDKTNESYTTDGFNTPVLNKELIIDKYNNIKIREGVSYNLKDNTCRDDRNSIIDGTITNFNVILKVADRSFLYDSNNRAVFDITNTRVLLDEGMYCTSNGTIYNSAGTTLVSGTTISNSSNGAITKDSSKIYYKGVLLKDNSNNIYYRGKKVYNSSSKEIYDKNEITTITDIDNLYISIDSSYRYYYKEKTIKNSSNKEVVDANNKINDSKFSLDDNDNVYYNGLLVKDNIGNVYKQVRALIDTSNNTLTVNNANVKYLYEKVGNTYKIYNVYGEPIQCSLLSCDSYYNIHSLNNIKSKGISDILTLFKKYEYKKGANDINIKVNVNYNFDNIAAKDLLLVNGENNISNYRIVATPQVLTTESVKDSTITAYVANKNGDIVPYEKIEEEGLSFRYSIDGASDVSVIEDTVNISNVRIYNNVKFRLYKNGKIVSEEIVDVIGDIKYITSVEYVNVTKAVSNYSIEPKNSSIYGDAIEWRLNSSDGGKVYYDASGLDISAGYSKSIVLDGICNRVKVYEKTIVPIKDGKDGSNGATGSKGDRGLVVYPAGVYDSSTKYVISNNTTPYVEHKGMYYVLIKSNTSAGQTPTINSTYWTPMEKYKAIYTEMMIADGGTLGGAVFDGNGVYMFSKLGKDASGENSSTYQKFSTNTTGNNIYDKVNTLFKPSMLFNFESGKGYMDNGNIIFDDGILLKDNALIQTYDELTTRDKFISDTFYDNIQLTNNAIIFTDVDFEKSLGVEKLNSIISIDGTKFFGGVTGANTLILILTKECGNLPKDKYVKGSVIFTNGTLSNIVYINNGNLAKISNNTSREIKFLFKWNGTEKRYSISDNNNKFIKTITALNGNYIFY